MPSCYQCFSSDINILGSDPDFNVSVFSCNACGLIQCEMLSENYLSSYYANNYRVVRNESFSDFYISIQKKRALAQNNFIRASLSPDFLFHDVLEIGAGIGAFLDLMPSTSSCFATEQDPQCLGFLNKKSHISIINPEKIFDESFYGKFNFVSLSHVFEHLSNPLHALFQLYKLLADDGYLFLEVPNEPASLVENDLNVKRQGQGHLFHYTVSSLSSLIAKSGLFDLVDIKTFSISVSEFIKNRSFEDSWDENPEGDGIHIRILLRKKIGQSFTPNNYSFLDSLVQPKFHALLSAEDEITKLNAQIKSLNQKFDAQIQSLNNDNAILLKHLQQVQRECESIALSKLSVDQHLDDVNNLLELAQDDILRLNKSCVSAHLSRDSYVQILNSYNQLLKRAFYLAVENK